MRTESEQRFYKKHLRDRNAFLPTVFTGTPTWGNYKPLFENAGFKVKAFRHAYRSDTKPDTDSILEAAEAATEGSIFVLQACCHNPTGLDYHGQRWESLAGIMLRRQHLAFFDIAYKGFVSDHAEGLHDDAFAIRHFAHASVDILAQLRRYYSICKSSASMRQWLRSEGSRRWRNGVHYSSRGYCR